MKILILQCGKTQQKPVQMLCEDYYKRLGRYVPVQEKTLPDLKNTRAMSEEQVMQQEANQIADALEPHDWVVLLDEVGQMMSSRKLANRVQQWMNQGPKRLVFVIGGPYGLAPELEARGHFRWSLSPLTFSHQLIRALLAEQLYRAFSILKGDPYHHGR